MFKINSNFINIKTIRYYSNTVKINNKLCPYWITGFADAESSFSVRIMKNKERKVGWRVLPIFSIELHKRDVLLLKQVQTFFDVGNIYERRSNVVYSVQSFNDLSEVIIPHFNKYPLLTQKQSDFLLFKLIVNLLNNKSQSYYEGLQEIINIRASMNKGLSKKLLESFPNTIPLSRPTINSDKILHPNWLVGFVDGEGCFYIKPKKLGFSVNISISQHSRDDSLLNVIMNYLDCGVIERPSTRPNVVNFVVYKFDDICEKVIPFFKNYPLQGIKYLDYVDFCKVVNLLNNKSQLTLKELEQIRRIKLGMNKGRI